MSYNDSLDDLGDAIDAIIDRAINSKDFQNLDETIRKAVNSAVDTGSEAVRARQQAPRAAQCEYLQQHPWLHPCRARPAG